MEIIEIDIFQTQESTAGFISDFIYIDIFQTQEPGVGDEDKVAFKINPAFFNGVPTLWINKPRTVPLIVRADRREPTADAQVNPIRFVGQIYLKLKDDESEAQMFVAYDYAAASPGEGQDLRYANARRTISGAINPETGANWKGQQGNQIGEAL